MFDLTFTALAGIALGAVVCQWLAWRLRLPVILLLLGAGLIAGPVTGLLQPDALFGALPPLLYLAIAVVLFEGSLSFRLNNLNAVGGTVFKLVSLGALLNGVLLATAAHLLLALPWTLAALCGAILLIGGDNELLPLLRRARAGNHLTTLLRQEAALLAPLATLIAVLFYAGLMATGQPDPLLAFGAALLAGGLVGFGVAHLLALLLRRHLLPPHLVNITTLALVLGGFTLAATVEPEAGLLAVVAMGMTLANMKDLPLREAVDFRESLSATVLSLLFLLVAARIDQDQLMAVPGTELLLLLAVLLLARPLVVLLVTWGAAFSWRERLLAGWLAPRGILASAAAALLALPLLASATTAAPLLPLLLLLVLTSLLLQHLTARPLARLLGLAEQTPRGVLIIGAHSLARAIARTLEAQGVRAVIADTDWEEVQQARMDGLSAFLGNPVSEQADRSLDLIGIGHLLAMSHRPALNALACQRYGREFGADHVYSLLTAEEKRHAGKSAIGRNYAATRLFGGDLTLNQLNGMLGRGGEVRLLSGEQAARHDTLIPLFRFAADGTLHILTGGEQDAQPGEQLIALIPPAEKRAPATSAAVTTAATA